MEATDEQAFDSAELTAEEIISEQVLLAEDALNEVEQTEEVIKAQIIDLFEALKQSLDGDAVEEEPAPKKKAKKAKKKASSKGEDVEPRPVKKASPRKKRAKKTSTG